MDKRSSKPPSEADAGVKSDDAHTPAEPITALVVGATGLVGRALLGELLTHSGYDHVRAMVRRPIEARPKLEVRVVDFEKPDSWGDALDVKHVFCCLGTTIKKAGSEPAFRHVDHDLPLEIARRAKGRGATSLFIVTAIGADPSSKIFYSRVKGELERDLKELGYPTLAVFRPSLLLGERAESRLAERVGSVAAKALAPLLQGGLRKYRPIAAEAVASAIRSVAASELGTRDPLGTAIYESDAIEALAEKA